MQSVVTLVTLYINLYSLSFDQIGAKPWKYINAIGTSVCSLEAMDSQSSLICDICSALNLYVMYMVQWEVYSRYIRRTEVNIPPRLYIETIDQPTVLYMLYGMVSAQQTKRLPEDTSWNVAIFAWKSASLI